MTTAAIAEIFKAPDVRLAYKARVAAQVRFAAVLPDGPVMDIYGRVSKIYNDGYRSVPLQIREAREVFDSNAYEQQGWTLGEAFQNDAGIGATYAARKRVRQDFETLMSRLATGKSHGFMVYDLSRFTRRPDEGLRLLEITEVRPYIRIHVVSADERRRLDTAEGRAAFLTDVVNSEKETNKATERYTRGREDKAMGGGRTRLVNAGFGLSGYYPTPQPKPVDWDPARDRVPIPTELVDREQAALRWAVNAILDHGKYLSAVAEEWTRRGVFTRTGLPFDGDAVRAVLSRPLLAGYSVHQGQIKGKLREGAVIDPERWQRVMDVFATRSTGRPHERSLLGGVPLCGRCGTATLIRSVCTERDTVTYRCARRTRAGQTYGCLKNYVPADWLDERVKAATIAYLSRPENTAMLAARRGGAGDPVADARLAELRAELVDAEEAAGMLAMKLAKGNQRGGMRPEVYAEADAALSARIETIYAQIEAATPSADELRIRLTTDIAHTWATAEATGDLKTRQALVRLAFPKLTVVPNSWDGLTGRASRPARIRWAGIDDAERARHIAG